MRLMFFSRERFAFLAVSFLSIIGGWGVVNYGGDFRYLLFIAILFVLVAVVFIGSKGLNQGFMIWIWMFILGYRTMQVTSNFKIHPLLILLTLLFVVFVFVQKSERRELVRLPIWLWVFSPFWIAGFISGALRGIYWLNMLADALNFIFLFPLLMVILHLSRERNFWQQSLMTFLASGVAICLLGIVEFYFPQVLKLLPGFIQADQEGLVSFSGFIRANFSFWGATPAIIVGALPLPLVMLIPTFYKRKISIFLALIVAGIICLAIYISGTRAAWLMLLMSSIFLAYYILGLAGLALGTLFWLIASRFFSTEMWILIFSMFKPFTSNQIMDGSFQKRFDRQGNAFALALQNPLGVGWTGSGWVHGDFVQVAANLGLAAGIIFLGWYLHTLYRTWVLYRKKPGDRILESLMACFVLCGFILATEGVEVLPQYIMPVWFVWGMVESYLQSNTANTTGS